MKFSDLATIRRQTVQPSDFGGFDVYVGFEHLDPGALRLNSYGSPADVSSTKQRFHAGDTIYGKLRPYFRKVAFADGLEGICSTDLWVFEPQPGVDPRFVFYVAASREFTDVATSSSEGTRMPRASWSVVKDFELRDIPFAEQRDIAAALGSLDAKIGSNVQLIRGLESLGSALLESALGVTPGEIPRYDTDRCLGDVLNILETGSRPKHAMTSDGDGVVSLGAENVQSAGVVAAKEFKRVSVSFANTLKRGRLEDEDVLVYKDGGKPGNFTPHVSAFGHGFPVRDATINEHVYRVRSGAGISQALLYWLLRSSWMDLEMRKRGTGVAIPGLNSSNFRELPLPSMSDTTVKLLNDQLTPLLSAMLRHGTENLRLAELRDALLPEFLFGRLSVPHATDLVAELAP